MKSAQRLNFFPPLDRIADVCWVLIVAYATLSVTLGTLRLQFFGDETFISGRYGTVLGLCIVPLLCWSWFKVSLPWFPFVAEAKRRFLGTLFCVVTLLMLLCSNFFDRRFTFFSDSQSKVDLVLCMLGCFFLLLAHKQRRFSIESSLRLFLLASQMTIAGAFLHHLHGRLLFSDDHASFFYRLSLLKNHFPSIPFYNTDWNAGLSAREFFASGVLNVFFLSWPAIMLCDFSSPSAALIYNGIITGIFLGLAPWAMWLSTRLFGFSRRAAYLAAIFALGPELEFFRWLLKYGTIGFCTSTILLPLAFALAVRVFLGETPPRYRDLVGFFIVFSLTLFWTLSFLAFVPLGLLVLWRWKFVFSGARRGKLMLLCAALLLAHGPWILTFLAESKVTSFVSQSTLPGTRETKLASGVDSQQTKASAQSGFADRELKTLRTLCSSLNPLLLVSIVGLFLWPQKGDRRLVLVTGSWLLLIGLVLDEWKPQLELHRMVIPGTFILLPLAGEFLDDVLSYLRSDESSKIFTSIARTGGHAVMLAFFFYSPISILSIYRNHSDEKFSVANDEVRLLGEAIGQYGGAGRTFITGFVLHELSSTSLSSQDGGHVAPLTMLSGKPMYAFEFYHSKWASVDPIPQSFRKRGREGIEEFFDLVNVSAVVTFRSEWRDYFLADPEHYAEVAHVGRFRVFQRHVPNASYFLEGSGSVRTQQDGIWVSLTSDHAVLKFRYYPRLKAVPNVITISGQSAFTEEIGGGREQEVNFVRLERKDANANTALEFFLSF